MHACVPQGLAFKQGKNVSSSEAAAILLTYTKKLQDPLSKTSLPPFTSTTYLQHIYSQSNTYTQPTLNCHLLDICQSNEVSCVNELLF